MKKLIFFLFFASIVVGLAIYYKQTLHDLIYVTPCDYPIHYKIGNIDARFNLTTDQFTQDVQQATNIWNQVEQKPLFIYDPQGTLTISMSYDQRQTLSNQINTMDSTLKQEKNSISPQMQQYKNLSADFEKRLAILNTTIAYWNSHGGAPTAQYKQIQDERTSLQKEADQINQLGQSLNKSTNDYNNQIDQLNQSIQSFDTALQVKPEEGLYNSNNNTIVIYFNNGQDELLHTLAHELGHSLGMQHASNPYAVMYYQTNNAVIASPDDIAQLQTLCQKQFFTHILAQKLLSIVRYWEQ